MQADTQVPPAKLLVALPRSSVKDGKHWQFACLTSFTVMSATNEARDFSILRVLLKKFRLANTGSSKCFQAQASAKAEHC